MPEIKWIDAREFREAGFLQEANRLFFHPHGLALAVTTVKDEGPVYTLALSAAQYETLREVLAERFDIPESIGGGTDDVREVIEAVDAALRYDVGDSYFQGVWDYRDDPEGVIFGSWYGQDREKVERVAAEREKHREARTAMFGEDTDVEPIGWEAPPDA
jgi:hypothetical protein